MQLDLGSSIRRLRRRDGRTQEALAEALGVTAQAVSRWEAGGGYPDVTLIPVIANCFGVSIDELFGYADSRERRIDELVERIDDMHRQNNGVDRSIGACIALARTALIEFPGNPRLMGALASALYTAGYVRHGERHLTDAEGFSVYDAVAHRQYAEWREAMALYEKALETLPSGPLRDRAVGELTQLYVNTGEHAKALALADAAPPLTQSRELLRTFACDGRQQAGELGRALLRLLGACEETIVRTVLACQAHMTPGQKAQALQGAIELFGQVCGDGGYGRWHSLVAHLHLLRSLYLWLDGDRDAAFAALDQALAEYRAFERVCAAGEERFDAPLLQCARNPLGANDLPAADDPSASAACLPQDWPWWAVPEQEEVRAAMQADPRWAEWVARTQMLSGREAAPGA